MLKQQPSRRSIPTRRRRSLGANAGLNKRRSRFEVLEARQLLAAEIEPNDSVATATLLPADDIAEGVISGQGDVDYFSVVLQAGDRFDLNTFNQNAPTFSPTLPPGLELYDADGNLLLSSYDGSRLSMVTPRSGTHFLRIQSENAFGHFVGDYGMQTNVTAATAVTESEPNDLPFTPSPLPLGREMQNTISPTDVDRFNFSAEAGDTFVASFAGILGVAPNARLLDSGGTVITSDSLGRGLTTVLGETGEYILEVTASSGGGIFDQYVMVADVLPGAPIALENGSGLDSATDWNLQSEQGVLESQSRIASRLDTTGDVDVFRFEVNELAFVDFTLDISGPDFLTSNGKTLKLYNQYGQFLARSNDGQISTERTDGFAPGAYYLEVSANSPIGVGAYGIRANVDRSFSPQRDATTHFVEFDQDTSYFGNDRVADYGVPEAIDYYIGSFNAKYAAYDVITTLDQPTDGNDFVQQGIGNFGGIGAGGLGSYRGGLRSTVGLAVTETFETNTNGLSYLTTPTVYHEFGHAVGLPHARDVQAFMSYVGTTERLPSGSIFSFRGTDSRQPGTSVNNHRNYVDVTLQSGAQVVVAEDADDGDAAISLDSYLREMSIDHRVDQFVTTNVRPSQVVAGDFNGDGREDVAALNVQNGELLIYLADVQGQLTAPVVTDVTTVFFLADEPMTVADFNGDGRDDLAIGLRSTSQIAVFLANAAGVMAVRNNIATSSAVNNTEVGDFDGDGDLDIAATTNNSRLLIYNNDGAGVFAEAANIATTANVSEVAVGDINGDGQVDVLVAGQNSNEIEIFENTSGALSSAGTLFAAGDVRGLAMDDFTGDGADDVAVITDGPRLVQVFASVGGNEFEETFSTSAITNPQQIQTDDVDGDGSPDLLVGGRSVSASVLLGEGFGQFTRPIVVGSSNNDEVSITAADLDGDGNKEFITAEFFQNQLAVSRETADNPANDKVVIFSSLDGEDDVDRFTFDPAGETRWDIDIDAAEFQMPVDAFLIVSDENGNLLARSDDAVDRQSGIASVDPYISLNFEAASQIPAGPLTIEVVGLNGSSGSYRLKLTPGRAIETDAPRVIAAYPDNGAAISSTNQIIVLLDDIIDPASVNGTTVQVTNAAGGQQSGTVRVNPTESTLSWTASSVLGPGTYTLTLDGITDYAGNELDGETLASFAFPDVSGDGTAGGDFTTTFTINSIDSTPATVSRVDYVRDPYQRGKFTISLTDDLSVESARRSTFRLRGPGPDGVLSTSDDTLTPLDVVYDFVRNSRRRQLNLYSRGIPDSGVYQIEGQVVDSSGFNVVIAEQVAVAGTVPVTALFTNAGLTSPGLAASFVNSSLRGVSANEDWRVTQTISGTRTDERIDFRGAGSFGDQSTVGVTGGDDDDWDDFSVQWDGFLNAPNDGVRLQTLSEDGSRLWIDLDRDGTFGNTPAELVNNGWGSAQFRRSSNLSVPLTAGVYPIRIQYETTFGGETMSLQWVNPGQPVDTSGFIHGPSVVGTSVSSGAVLTNQSQLERTLADGSVVPDSTFSVTFSSQIDPQSLTTGNLFLRRSDDNQFFDSEDEVLLDADGVIEWDASTLTATIDVGQPLRGGFYVVEVNGEAGGVRDLAGNLLDGEFLTSVIAGNDDDAIWKDQPSGDGIAGGSYRSSFAYSPSRLRLEPSLDVISERGGVTDMTLTRLYSSTTTSLLVSLANGDNSELSLPSLVTIPAGETSVTFSVSGVDDQVLDGLQTVSVQATASGIESGDAEIGVSDFEQLLMSFGSTEISERGGVTDLILTRTDASIMQTVTLSIDDPTEVTAATSVVFPVGVQTVRVPVIAIDDSILDGTQSVTFTTLGTGLVRETAVLQVTDFEPIVLQLSASEMSENGGQIDGVLRRTDATGSLVATVTSDPASALANPVSVVFFPGQRLSQPFVINASDNDLLDGTRTIDVIATAVGYESDSAPIRITDSEALSVVVDNAVISELDGETFVRVLRTDPRGDLTGTLAVEPAGEVEFDPTVTFVDGQALSEPINIMAIDDFDLTGTQSLTLTASVGTYIDGNAELLITDHEELSATLLTRDRLPLGDASIPENSEGILLRISVPNNVPAEHGPVTVFFNTDAPQSLDIPASAVITPGATLVDVLIQPFDNDIVETDELLNITADADGFVSTDLDLTIVENDEPMLSAELVLPITQVGAAIGEMPEADGAGSLLLTRNTVHETSVRLNTVPGDMFEFPTEIVFPRGFRVLEVPFNSIDNGFVDGDRDVQFVVNVIGHPVANADVKVIDDEQAGVVVLAGDGSAITQPPVIRESALASEGNNSAIGQSTAFSVSLPSAPVSNVVFDVIVSDDLRSSVQQLTFTSSNWNLPQPFLVTAADDNISGGDRFGVVRLDVDDNASNPSFREIPAFEIPVQILDDDQPGISVIETLGSTFASEFSSVDGGGLEDSFSLQLETRPTAAVTLTFDNSEIDSVAIIPNQITFTPENWNVPQTLRVQTDLDFNSDGHEIGIVYIDVDPSTGAVGYDSIGRRRFSVVHVDTDLSDLRLRPSDNNQVALVDESTGTVLRQSSVSSRFTTGSRSESITVEGGTGLNTLDVHLGGGDDTLTAAPALNAGGFAGIRVAMDGGDGYDTLRLAMPGLTFQPDLVVSPNDPLFISGRNIERLDVTGNGSQNLLLSPVAVRRMTDSNNDLFVSLDAEDSLDRGQGWTLQPPERVEGVLSHVFVSGETTLRQTGGTLLQNPVVPTDVNASGEVTALDALMIINRLNSGDGSAEQSVVGALDSDWQYYFDVNGDGLTTALDALQTINYLNGMDSAIGEPGPQPEAIEALSDGASIVVNQVPLSSMALYDDETDLVESGLVTIDSIFSSGDLSADGSNTVSNPGPAGEAVFAVPEETESVLGAERSLDDSAIDGILGDDDWLLDGIE